MGGAYRCNYTRKRFRTLYHNLFGPKRVREPGFCPLMWTKAEQESLSEMFINVIHLQGSDGPVASSLA